jgi:hypothetical protein
MAAAWAEIAEGADLSDTAVVIRSTAPDCPQRGRLAWCDRRRTGEPRGRDEILHDIGHFISGGTQRFYGREFILR